MKNSNHLAKLALSLAAPAICAWLIAGREFSADLLLGAYTLAGLFFLTAADYMPRRVFASTAPASKPAHRWIRASRARTGSARRAHRGEKLAA